MDDSGGKRTVTDKGQMQVQADRLRQTQTTRGDLDSDSGTDGDMHTEPPDTDNSSGQRGHGLRKMYTYSIMTQ